MPFVLLAMAAELPAAIALVGAAAAVFAAQWLKDGRPIVGKDGRVYTREEWDAMRDPGMSDDGIRAANEWVDEAQAWRH